MGFAKLHCHLHGTAWAVGRGTVLMGKIQPTGNSLPDLSSPRTHSRLHHYPTDIFLSSQAALSVQLLSTHHSGAALKRHPLLSERSGPLLCLLMDSHQLTTCTCGCINEGGGACKNMYSLICAPGVFFPVRTYKILAVLSVVNRFVFKCNVDE